MRTALARHDEILRDAVVAARWPIVKTTGDGVHAAFASAHEAVGAAADAQRRAARRALAAHGPAARADGTAHRRSRIARRRLLRPGASTARRGSWRGARRPDRRLARDRGARARRPAVRRRPGRPRRAPAPRPRPPRACLPGRAHPTSSASSRRCSRSTRCPGNLRRRAELVGRTRDVDAVVTALGARPGGHAHRRRAAWARRGSRSQVAAPASAPSSRTEHGCASSRRVTDDETRRRGARRRRARCAPASGHDARRQRRRLRCAPKRLLLVLDNCEHLLDAVAELVGPIARRLPRVRVLATSREALGVDGEQIVRCRSLPVPLGHRLPTSDRRIELGEAVRRAGRARPRRLRARRVDERRRRSPSSAGGSTASRSRSSSRRPATRSMTPAEIVDRLDERFRLLTGGRRTARRAPPDAPRGGRLVLRPARPASSGGVRSPRVFAGAFTSTRPRPSWSTTTSPAWDARDAIAGLVAKSMLVIDDTSSVATRYRLLETLPRLRGQPARRSRRRRYVEAPPRRVLHGVRDASGFRPLRTRRVVVASPRPPRSRQSPCRGDLVARRACSSRPGVHGDDRQSFRVSSGGGLRHSGVGRSGSS